MPKHLSFIDEAVTEFLEAFELHQRLVALEPEKRELRAIASCIRSFALALEKGCKHALAEIDPYLLITKPDRIVQLRQDMCARPVPSIFCSRHPFDTLSLGQTWKTLREVASAPLDPDVSSAFDRSLTRLIDIRNRAYHGEIYGDPDELLAMLDELLARFAAVMDALNPEWLNRLSVKNGQLLSRLRGIEAQVDASWQVLVDYLQTHGPFEFPVQLYATSECDDRPVKVIFGSSATNNMLGGSDVSRGLVGGLFASHLTKQQIDDRYTARRRSDTVGTTGNLNLALAFGIAPKSQPNLPLIPIDSGKLAVPTTSVWLSLFLPKINPNRLSLSATLIELHVEFPDGNTAEGTLAGKLECPLVKGTHMPSLVEIRGSAYLDSEWYFPEDIEKSPPEPEHTTRCLNVQVQLTIAT